MKIVNRAVSIVAVAGLLGGLAALAGEHKQANKKEEAVKDAVQAGENAKMQTTCPVMGGKINKDLYVDVEGKRVYVCCKGCIGKVKENPEKYIRKLEEQGVTLASPERRSKMKGECRKKKAKPHCRMKADEQCCKAAESKCCKKAEAACPKAKDCPKDKCPMGEKKKGHAGHHKEEAE